MDSIAREPEWSGVLEAPAGPGEQTLDLHGYFYGDRANLLPQLTLALTHCGGWVLERRTMSPTMMELRFELQLSEVVELYGALAGLGLELTRDAHTLLTDLCTCRKHSRRASYGMQVLTLRLEIRFMADVTLHSILMTGSGLA
jgi:hypothetical protein